TTPSIASPPRGARPYRSFRQRCRIGPVVRSSFGNRGADRWKIIAKSSLVVEPIDLKDIGNGLAGEADNPLTFCHTGIVGAADRADTRILVQSPGFYRACNRASRMLWTN